MTSLTMLIASAVTACFGGVFSLAAMKNETLSKGIGCVFGMFSALFGIGCGLLAIFGPEQYVSFATPFAFANFTLLLNPLAGLLIGVISLLAFAAWIYGLRYFDEYKGSGLGTVGFFMNMFVVSMLFVVVADNVFWFLVFFELMSLSSYFLVIIEQDKKSIKGGFLYLIMAHVGFFLIMIAFYLMSSQTGSFEFSSFRGFEFTPVVASISFVLAFIGFGCKAGMVPFHSWLPQAHPAAPSNVSALMSGGMIKIGIFGIVKVGLDLLQSCQVELWWGLLILGFGAVSSVLGVAYALAEHDIKRLLAYHSVENIGIILLGVGVGFIGISVGQPLLAALGMMAGLYHLFNHAVFKGLLFFGAGSLLFATHTRDMEKMGGLAKLMPVTAGCFLIGALAISAIPPLNGFVSEWYTYQSMLTVAIGGDPILKIAAVIGIVSLAITGALAVTCFVKAYGVSFLSSPRSEHAANAKEVSASMKFTMILLAAICVIFGVGAAFIAPVFDSIASSIISGPEVITTSGLMAVNPFILGAAVSTPIMAIALVLFVGIVFVFKKAVSKGGTGIVKDPWACGYQPDTDMPVVATNFGTQVQMFLKPLYTVREFFSRFKGNLDGTIAVAEKTEGFADKYLVGCVAKFVNFIGRKVRVVEGGDFRVYVLYVVAALVFFLALIIFFN